jgi:hypothetical protein
MNLSRLNNEILSVADALAYQDRRVNTKYRRHLYTCLIHARSVAHCRANFQQLLINKDTAHWFR